MRKILFFVFVVSCFVTNGQNIDVLHYQFNIGLNDRNDTIQGAAILEYLNSAGIAKAEIDLTSAREGKGMKVLRVQNGFEEKSNLNFSQSAEKLVINLPSGNKNNVGMLIIHYEGVPTGGLIISKNKYGDRTFFSDNWPNRAHHWIPCIDRPDDKASFEFLVTAPSHYRVISNGIKEEEKEWGNGFKLTHWKEDIPSPTKVMVIGVAKFATKVYNDSRKDIPVSAWFYPQDSSKGFYDYAVTPSILKFFADYIGPFPYKKLANVQSKTEFGGMENASCIFYNEDYVTGRRQHEDVMAHEIAHQWFGDMVSEKSFAHLWLSEGFADYFEHYYFEKKYGEETARKKWEQAREEVISFASYSSKAVVDSTEDLMSLLNANSYKKGAWVLRMLRYEVGDSVFQNIIRTYYNQYKGGNAETRDFEAVAEKVSGKELTWFFDQWLYQQGIPKLYIRKEVSDKGSWFVLEQRQKNLYNLVIPLILKTNSRKETKAKIKLTKSATVIFASNDKNAQIIIDPDMLLLFEQIK